MNPILSAEEATLWKCLGTGSRNGKTSMILTQETGFNRRKICDAVEGLRMKGYPVGAFKRNRIGYFKIETQQELMESVNQLRKQAKRELLLARKLESVKLGQKEIEHE